MTTLDQLRTALERVKKATGPDREIDKFLRSIWPDYARAYDLTASLDAVVALVERETWNGEKLLWSVAYDEDGVAGPRSYCGSTLVGHHSPIVWYGHSDANPALALLAAFLRARIAKMETT